MVLSNDAVSVISREVISLDEIDDADFAPESEIVPTPRFPRPRWTPPTHFAPMRSAQTTSPTVDEEFEP